MPLLPSKESPKMGFDGRKVLVLSNSACLLSFSAMGIRKIVNIV